MSIAGIEDHAADAAASSTAKLRSSARPSREDFSGWNWTPMTWPRSTIEANGLAVLAAADDVASSAGRQANECTW